MVNHNILSPNDGRVVASRTLADKAAINRVLDRAKDSQKLWRSVPLSERKAICTKFIDAFIQKNDEIAIELTAQMGRPISQTPAEIAGMTHRARMMIDLAENALHLVRPTPVKGFDRFIRREPLGLVYVIGAWNYPYLITVNSVIPALLAGNVVVLKQALQTVLCAERFADAFAEAGLPNGVFQYLHISNEDAESVITDSRVDFVAFTGSVATGHRIVRAAANRFIGIGLELGGKDPAYVRGDADIAHAVGSLVDGAFFNSGQSCCAIERIYVAAEVYDIFIERFVDATYQYRLGDPISTETTLGPMINATSATFVRGQITGALTQGARALIDGARFPGNIAGTAFLAPQVLINVNHNMNVMIEESFGPVVGIMKVATDGEALSLMNDSRYGLSASIWTQDTEAALQLGNHLDTGTVFMNRCDYLDPALAWVGTKESGRGCTLSSIGFEYLTRPKSFHFRTALNPV